MKVSDTRSLQDQLTKYTELNLKVKEACDSNSSSLGDAVGSNEDKDYSNTTVNLLKANEIFYEITDDLIKYIAFAGDERENYLIKDEFVELNKTTNELINEINKTTSTINYYNAIYNYIDESVDSIIKLNNYCKDKIISYEDSKFYFNDIVLNVCKVLSSDRNLIYEENATHTANLIIRSLDVNEILAIDYFSNNYKLEYGNIVSLLLPNKIDLKLTYDKTIISIYNKINIETFATRFIEYYNSTESVITLESCQNDYVKLAFCIKEILEGV